MLVVVDGVERQLAEVPTPDWHNAAGGWVTLRHFEWSPDHVLTYPVDSGSTRFLRIFLFGI